MQITLNIPHRPDLSRLFTVHDPAQDLHVSRQLAEKGYWELYETQLILARLEPGQVFIDVGANVGYYAVLAAQQVGSEGQVVAFEPAPENFALLEKNCTGLDQVRCVQAALAAEDGSGQVPYASLEITATAAELGRCGPRLQGNGRHQGRNSCNSPLPRRLF